jgi:transcriptional regulator with XRE-family HTH domain
MANDERNDDLTDDFSGVVEQDAVGRVSEAELDRLARMLAANLRLGESRSEWKSEYLEAEKRTGANIRDQRIREQISQEQLAQALNSFGFELHQSTIAKIEAGKRPLRLAELFAFADALNVPWMNLIEGGRDIDILPNEGMVPLDVWEAGLEELVLKREDALRVLVEAVEDQARAYADWDRMILVRVAALANAAARSRVLDEDDRAQVGEIVEKWSREASYWARQREKQFDPAERARVDALMADAHGQNKKNEALAREFLQWRQDRASTKGVILDGEHPEAS